MNWRKLLPMLRVCLLMTCVAMSAVSTSDTAWFFPSDDMTILHCRGAPMRGVYRTTMPGYIGYNGVDVAIERNFTHDGNITVITRDDTRRLCRTSDTFEVRSSECVAEYWERVEKIFAKCNDIEDVLETLREMFIGSLCNRYRRENLRGGKNGWYWEYVPDSQDENKITMR